MNAKILIVDDEPDILYVLEALLTAEGFQIRKASGGQEALDVYQAESVDLVITDIKMPDMDGLELIRQLRALNDNNEVEIIVLTGFASLDNAIEALQGNGAFDFLRKPLEHIDAFFNTVRQALEKRRLCIQNRRLLEELQIHSDNLEELVRARTAELVRSNEKLQREIIERKRVEHASRQAKEAAEAANYAKTVFLANMSHEFRTPLNGVLGFAGLLKKDDSLTESQKSYVELIEQSGNRLLKLVVNILDVSRLEAQQLELHGSDFRLPEFLTGIVKIAQEQAQQKELVFHYKADPDLSAGVRGDEQRLRQVLLSLLSNAVRFTDEGGVTLKVAKHPPTPLKGGIDAGGTDDSPLEGGRGVFCFQVEDTGIGIPADQLEAIFTPFKQVIGDTHKIDGGAGLGLAVSRRLIRLMGSNLHVQSTPGKGSTFWFELELPEAAGIIEEKEEYDALDIQSETKNGPIIPPPVEEVSQLYKLAKMGDIFEIRARIEEIDKLDPKYALFAANIRLLVEDLDILKIQCFLKQYLED